MALLRVNPPSQPVRYVELGPARGRLTAAGGRSMGGPLREQESPWTRNARLSREYQQRLSDEREAADKALAEVLQNPDNGGVEATTVEVQT